VHIWESSYKERFAIVMAVSDRLEVGDVECTGMKTVEINLEASFDRRLKVLR
jgi:hypothetical protein